MKVVKILLKLVVGIVVFALVALLTLPLWFGPVVKAVANSAVPGVVKTDFHLGHLSLNPYTARFELGDMQLANPEGYSEKQAVTVGEIDFDAETMSLVTDVIHIEEIKIKDVFASYVSGGPEKINNFLQIQYNVAGGKEKYEAAQAEKKAKEESKPKVEVEGGKKGEAKSKEAKSKKVIIDRLEISGLKVQYGIIPLKVPFAIVLTDIGRKSGGATLEETWNLVWAEILKAGGAVGDQIKALGGAVGDATKKATESVKKLGDSAKDLGNAAKDIGKSLNTEAGKKALDNSAKAVGDGAKAVGDGAKKALDSIKKLW